MGLADRFDELTSTFQLDKKYCEALFSSSHADQITELLLAHLWANISLPACYKSLSNSAGERFGPALQEKATTWTFILLDNLNRDLKVVPYLTIRGLFVDAGVALRRVYEHIGVLTHFWRDASKLEALEDPASSTYSNAFRREPNKLIAKALKDIGVTKRFASMRAGTPATLLYDQFSTFDVHGGTGHRFIGHDPTFTEFTCSFLNRPLPTSDYVGQKIGLLTDGHKLICAEMLFLCVDHGEKSTELVNAAKELSIFSYQENNMRSPELQEAIQSLLSKLTS